MKFKIGEIVRIKDHRVFPKYMTISSFSDPFYGFIISHDNYFCLEEEQFAKTSFKEKIMYKLGL